MQLNLVVLFRCSVVHTGVFVYWAQIRSENKVVQVDEGGSH